MNHLSLAGVSGCVETERARVHQRGKEIPSPAHPPLLMKTLPSPVFSAALMVVLWSQVLPASFGAALPKDDAGLSWPNPDWPRATPTEVGMDGAKLALARDYSLSGGGAGCILRHGRQVLAWGDPKQLYDLKSTTKSFGATVLGLTLMDSRVRLDDPAMKFCTDLGMPPATNARTGWLDNITLRMLPPRPPALRSPVDSGSSSSSRGQSGITATAVPTGSRIV